MRAATLAPTLFLTFLAPSLAAASWLNAPAEQLRFDLPSLHRVPSTRAPSQQQQAALARPNPSVVVAVVDPASPSTSNIVDAAALSSRASFDDDDEDVQEDAPNFGAACTFESTYTTCGDFFDEESELDHGLFCSPAGVCGGKGAACGASEACSDGLICNLSSHRCVTATAKLLSIEHDRKAARRKTAAYACPEGAQACPSGIGGFECVHTATDDQHCGGCLGMGGVDCSAIPNALATSCRHGACVVHACNGGFRPDAEGGDCVDDMFYV
ncbi:hypothetical protein JCM10207_008147 [Rhodosporidiobolus poonsookiae]